MYISSLRYGLFMDGLCPESVVASSMRRASLAPEHLRRLMSALGSANITEGKTRLVSLSPPYPMITHA